MLIKTEKGNTAPTCNTGWGSVVIRTVGGLLTLLLCLVDTISAEPSATRPLRVLFVGNSYTRYHNLSQVLSVMAASARPAFPLETSQYAFDSYTLERHWEDGQTMQAIRNGRWDHVVLQGHSLQPVRNPRRLSTFAQKLDAEIRKIGAHTLFFMTWAHQDKPTMLTDVVQTYNTVAAELDARVAPVGLAWQRALQERPALTLHAPDHSHPLPSGTYLTACVFYATLTGNTPLGLSTGGLQHVPPEDIPFLQRIAWETVTHYQKVVTPQRGTAPDDAHRVQRHHTTTQTVVRPVSTIPQE